MAPFSPEEKLILFKLVALSLVLLTLSSLPLCDPKYSFLVCLSGMNFNPCNSLYMFAVQLNVISHSHLCCQGTKIKCAHLEPASIKDNETVTVPYVTCKM